MAETRTVFIVRPFGVQEGIDFDAVERDLIRPVMDELGLGGGTTGEIAEAGNIRADMMDRLLTADIVIADISIHNANVFYELGVRHALRDRPTILIRGRVHAVPFDLKTDRYQSYDLADIEGSIAGLRQTVKDTLASQVIDSPVYQLLPDLEARDGSAYIAVPREFGEAVERARRNEDRARLGLLAYEARVARWWMPGLRLVGRAQFDRKANRAARATWEAIRKHRPDDTEANNLLGTIYQRLDDLPRSDEAIARVLSRGNLAPSDRAEALALRGRNLKTRWLESWKSQADSTARQRAALESGLLLDAMRAYKAGFVEDLNHYYSGLNALAMCTIVTELAAAHPKSWEARFEESDEAGISLKKLRRERKELADAVKLSLEVAKGRMKREGRQDVWLDFSIADHRLLTQSRPAYVRQGYADAIARIGAGFNTDATARQIVIYTKLGVLTENAAAALEGLGCIAEPPEEQAEPRERVILSTGHRIDTANRKEPRFPKDRVDRARAAIAEKIQLEKSHGAGAVRGIAGLASGSDILFHEVCADLGIPTEAGLALPEDEYLKRSVADAGPEWVERYRDLCDRLSPEVLGDAGPPPWVETEDSSYVFQRANLWLLEKAFAVENAEVTLIALWNGKGGDGPGGTADMVKIAKERGAKVVIIDTNDIFGL